VWASEKKRINPPQCLVWFRLNGFGSSQNDQNSLIHNRCIRPCSGGISLAIHTLRHGHAIYKERKIRLIGSRLWSLYHDLTRPHQRQVKMKCSVTIPQNMGPNELWHLSLFSLWLSTGPRANKPASTWRIPKRRYFRAQRNPDVPRRSFVLKAPYLNST
jgi:hypothetical protein